tara:strand:- start:1310 stop:1702 length:393 start_codon:yes stop_codon:yes gene_type:complete
VSKKGHQQKFKTIYRLRVTGRHRLKKTGVSLGGKLMFEKLKGMWTLLYEYRYLVGATLLVTVLTVLAFYSLGSEAAQFETIDEILEVIEATEEDAEDTIEEATEETPHAYNIGITRDNFVNAYVVEPINI